MHIYLITCTANNKIYVGSSAHVHDRQQKHFSTLKSNKHHNQHLQRAFNKYGSDFFEFEILETCLNLEDMLSREQYWIDKLRAADNNVGFNMCPVAGSCLGRNVKEETKKKISQSKLGHSVSVDTRRKLSIALKSNIVAAQTLDRIAASRRKLSDEQILNIFNLRFEGVSFKNISKYVNYDNAKVSQLLAGKKKFYNKVIDSNPELREARDRCEWLRHTSQ